MSKKRQREARGSRPRPIRSGLRRHGLVRRPSPIRRLFPVEGLRFTEGNRVTLYDNGRAGLAAMLEAIREARRHIHLETYIFRHDAMGRLFISALTDAAEAGVQVCVLYDALGSRGLDDLAFAGLRSAGGEIVAFNPIPEVLRHFRPRRRDHRKILVVDGEVAFTGGLNIGDEYEQGLAGGGWRDAHVRIEGPAVRDLQALFLESWFRADAPDLPWQAFLEQELPGRGTIRCAVVPDGPVYRRRQLRDLLIDALDNARAYARFASPYFAPGRRVLEALARASERGVVVELVLAGRTDHPVLRRAARTILPRLIARGMRVYEYEREMMHAKLAIFDDQWAVVGTSNLDRQSFEHSYEVNVIFEGAEIPAWLNAGFQDDVRASRRVDSAALAARGIVDRLLDRLAALVLFLI